MTKIVSAAEVVQTFDTLLDDVVKNGDEVLVEKDGRIVARLVPSVRESITLESMRGRLTILGDIVEPLNEPWEAND